MKMRVEKGLAHDLDTSVWRSGKKGRLRVGGDRFVRKKRSSSLLVCGSACSSAFFFTAHAFIHAGHYVTPSMMSRPSFG